MAEDNPCPHWYRVCLNTIVRKGVKLDSERMRILPMGSRVHVIDVQDRRVQIDQPINGWCSLRSSNGDTILTPLSDEGPSDTPKASYKMKEKNLQEKQLQWDKEHAKAEAELNNVRENNPKTKDLLDQMTDLKNKLNFHKNLLDSQEQLKKDFEQLLREKNTEDAQTKQQQEEFQKLLQLKEDLQQVAENEGLKNPLELQNHLEEIALDRKKNQQQLETYKTLAAAAERELNSMKKQMKDLMVGDPEVSEKNNGEYREGDVVQLKEGVGIAIVKYCGAVDAKEANADTTYIGVEFDQPIGDTDGTVEGKFYFKTKPGHGQFFPIEDVERKITAAQLLRKLNKVVQKVAQQQTATD